jgi:small subunit ribosomal protein S8
MYTDPIADLLTRIRNAYKARKDIVVIPHSKMKMSILKVLKDRSFVSDFSSKVNDKFEEIEIILNDEIRDISLRKISKPGQRIYIKHTGIKKINGGLGLAILSTPKGIMSGEQAKKQKLGGELICEVY